MVRGAVATVESVYLIPHFAKTEVTPANKAEANAIHIMASFSLQNACQRYIPAPLEHRRRQWLRIPPDC